MAKSNLFAIDLEASLRAVADANADLVAHHGRMMEARSRVPARLSTADDIQRARRFVEMLKTVADRCRKTRLEDTKPLKSLLKGVEAFFKTMEAEADQAYKEVQSLMTAAAMRNRAAARDARPEPAVVLHSNLSGEIIATVAPISPAPLPIPTRWEIAAVDRASVDLEALRPYLTEAALMTAAKAHLKAAGPHRLRGATYAETAVL